MLPTFYTFGPFKLSPSEHLLLREQKALPLAPKAFELLVVLAASQGRLLKREDLMEAIWPDSFVEEINLTVNISLLRKSLGAMPDGSPYIATVPKCGYRFSSPVIEHTGDLDRTPAQPQAPSLSPLASEASSATQSAFASRPASAPEPPFDADAGELLEWGASLRPSPAPHPAAPYTLSRDPASAPQPVDTWKSDANARRAESRRLLLAGVLLSAAIMVASAFWVLRTRHAAGALSPAAPAAIHSLAVLPFEFIGDTSLSYLGLGMTDALVTRLSGQSRIAVRPIGAVRRYSGATDLVQVGKNLKVDAVLDGTVQRLAGQTRVTVRLLRVDTGQAIWTDSFDEASGSAFTLEDAISPRLAEALTLHLTDEEQRRLAAPHTRSVAAYDLYTRGRFLLNNRSIESVRNSLDLFQQAIQADPGYAAAYAGLADAYILAGSYGNSFLAPSIAAPKAEEAVNKALALDEASPEAHTSLAYLRLTYDWDWPGAEQEFKRALDLNPASVNAHHWYSHMLMALGRIDDSHRQSERALALDPTDVLVNEHMAWHHLFSRQYDAAVTQALKAVEIDPNFVQAHRVLGLAYLYKGDSDRACPEFQTGVRLSHEDPVALAYLARCYAVTHREAVARQLAAQLESASRERYISAAEIGAVHAALGERKAALHWLDQACSERASALIYLNVDPVYDSMRNDPQFQAIVSRVHLPARPAGMIAINKNEAQQ